jgi:tetratricopeptide (TPR) repeat protein
MNREVGGAITLLAAAVLLAFGRVGSLGFLSYDDPIYITDNPRVVFGLTASGIGWAFRTFHGGNWHPLTWISHMLDVELFGLSPGPHHLVSLLLHLLNAILFFFLLRALTGRTYPPLAASLLFALHPFRVESVAWISERKDLLAALFWLLAMAAYLRYVRRPGPVRYLAVCFAFAAALLAKPMAVTLPLVLLLLDWWPLGRAAGRNHRRGMGAAVAEKVPLLLLSAATATITYLAQRAGGALSMEGGVHHLPRIISSLMAAARYLLASFLPGEPLPLHPYPLQGWSAGQVAGASVTLASLTLGAWAVRRRAPALAAGWLWFLISLAPVLGLVKVGEQFVADRYTYIPHLGLALALALALAPGLPRLPSPARRWRRSAGALATLASVMLLGRLTHAYVPRWESDLALFSYTAERAPSDWLARLNVGSALVNLGRHREAREEFLHAERMHPGSPLTAYNLGVVTDLLGEPGAAEAHFREALRRKPDLADAHNNLGILLSESGRLTEALDHYREAIRLSPNLPEPHYNLGVDLAALGDRAGARLHLETALGLKPGYAAAGDALARLDGSSP